MNSLFASAVTLFVALLAPSDTWAGCGDAMVARIDVADVLAFDEGHREPIEARLHGAFGWEKSTDGWSTHPIGGKQLGFVHLSCKKDDVQCAADLGKLVLLAGTGKPMAGAGRYAEAPPEGLHLEGEKSVAALGPYWPNGFRGGGGTGSNPMLWPEVQQMPLSSVASAAMGPARGCGATGLTLAPWALLLALTAVRRARR